MHHRRRIVLVVLGLLAAALVPLAAAPPAAADGTVTVTVSGPGNVSGDGIDCNQSGGPDCSEFYPDESTCEPGDPPPCFMLNPHITLTAEPGSGGFSFIEWTGCTSTSGLQCNVTVASNRTINARYGDTTPPTVSPPTPNSGVQRGTITLAAAANDIVGMNKVEFFNGAQKLGEDSSSPYQLAWNTTTVADGAKSITAKAHDAAGNVTTSAASGFTVDNTAPTVAVTSGPDGQTYGEGSTQTWQFTTSDATSGVASRECSVVASGSPASFGACSSVSTHSVNGLPGGTYEFVVRVTDAGGLTATSAPRTFSIDDVAPATSVTSGPARPLPGAYPHGAVRLRQQRTGQHVRMPRLAVRSHPARLRGLLGGRHAHGVRPC